MEKEKKEAIVSNPRKTNIIKDGFFGWKNLKWFIKEIINIYSNKDSYFSKKRIESGIAFIILQCGMIIYFLKKYQSMDIYDLAIWVGIEGIICGYNINKIEDQKKLINNRTHSDTLPDYQEK